MGTSGAPCPPAATSRGRKLLTTRTPKRSARTAGSPSCQVTVGGSCQTVCPGKAMKPRSLAGVRVWARRIWIASAAQSAMRTCSRAKAAASARAPGSSADRISARSASS
jgi:hypothetical protein